MVEALKVAAFIFGGIGAFAGFIIGSDDGSIIYEIAIPYWIAGIASFLLFAALGLILEHVKEIHVKVYPEKYAETPINSDTTSQEA